MVSFVLTAFTSVAFAEFPKSDKEPGKDWNDITAKEAQMLNKQTGIPILKFGDKTPVRYHQKFPDKDGVKRDPANYKFHDDFVKYVTMRLKDPNSFQELSYYENEDDYAMMSFTATNSYGGRVRGYVSGVWAQQQPYIFHNLSKKAYMHFFKTYNFYQIKMEN